MPQDDPRFSRRTADQLRVMAARAPEIADDLYDMADKLDYASSDRESAPQKPALKLWVYRNTALRPVSPFRRLYRRLRP